MAAVARWRRERTVPGGIPSASAASSSERTEVVVQDEDDPLIRVEAVETALELVTIGQIDCGVRRGAPRGP